MLVLRGLEVMEVRDAEERDLQGNPSISRVCSVRTLAVLAN